jgi:monoterpene epsilon-lactone hydrolase
MATQRPYEIVVRGSLGPTLLEAFPTLEASPHGGDTLLAGRLSDQGALFGVLCAIDDLGLEIVEIRCLVGSPPPTAAVARH